MNTSASIASKATGGAVALVIRRIAIALINIPASIVLARLLSPSDFGMYAIASFLVLLLQSNVSLGLGAWLIQSPEEPSEGDLASVYTAQLLMCTIAFLVLSLAAPALVSLYGRVDAAAVALVRVLGLSIFLVAFRVVPASLLERQLRYEYIANVEFIGVVILQTVAIALAASGAHVWSLVDGALASSAAVVLLMLRGAWWTPRLGLDFGIIRRAMQFAAPWQLHGWVNLIKDNIVPTLIGAQFGVQAVGYLTLASATAFRPLQVLPIIGRVSFSAYARLRNDSDRLTSAVDRVVFFSAAAIIPPTVLIAALGTEIVTTIYGAKWAPAVVPLQWFCVAGIVASVNSPATLTFFGLGRPWIALRITSAWAVAMWGLTILFTPKFGFIGYAIADASACCLVVWTLVELRRLVSVSVLGAVAKVLTASLVAGGLALWSARHTHLTVFTLVGVAGTLLLSVYGIIWYFERRRLEAVRRYVVGRIAAPFRRVFTRITR